MNTNSSNQCVSLLSNTFGGVPTAIDNTIEVEFGELSVGYWCDRGLFSVFISNGEYAYMSSVVAHFLNTSLSDAKENPELLLENLSFIQNNKPKIESLINQSDFHIKYEAESGFKPIPNFSA